jgi:hypothetical protein
MYGILLTLFCALIVVQLNKRCAAEEFAVEVIKFTNEFIPGLLRDYNLCQIYKPLSLEGDGKLFTGSKTNNPESISGHVRFIVLHKCRYSSQQDTFYGSFINRAFECEDTRFVQVNV